MDNTDKLFVQVEDGKIIGEPQALPEEWYDDNLVVLNFHTVEDPTEYGWYPVEVSPALPVYDPATAKLIPRLTFADGKVAKWWEQVGYTPEELNQILEVWRQVKVTEIFGQRDSKLQAGFAYTLHGTPEILQCRNADDRSNWLALAAMAESGDPAGDSPQVRTASNAMYTLTNQEASTMVKAILMWYYAILMNTWALKDATSRATTKADLDKVDPSEGWPA